jgi:hypothetical protein
MFLQMSSQTALNCDFDKQANSPHRLVGYGKKFGIKIPACNTIHSRSACVARTRYAISKLKMSAKLQNTAMIVTSFFHLKIL